MISDVLHDAELELDLYLTDQSFEGAYMGVLRIQLEVLRDNISAMRVVLDTPPPPTREDA